MNTKQILIMVAVAAVVAIGLDYVLPYKVDETTNELKRF